MKQKNSLEYWKGKWIVDTRFRYSPLSKKIGTYIEESKQFIRVANYKVTEGKIQVSKTEFKAGYDTITGVNKYLS